MPKVLVSSVPKSGTHLLLQMILGIPGMKIAPTWYFPGTADTLKDLPSGQVGPAHLFYTPEIARKLKNWGVKIIFISRDPRDIAVSLVHFIMANQFNHPHNPYLKHLNTHEERLLAMINGVPFREENFSRFGVRGWVNIYDFICRQFGWLNDPDICKVTFEELIQGEASQNQAILRIINYLWSDLQNQGLTKQEILWEIKGNIDSSHSATFRRGKIGDWREEFTEAHKKAFKEVAGQFLIQLGYEKDNNW